MEVTMSTSDFNPGPRRAVISRPIHAIGGDQYTGWYMDFQTTQVIHLKKGMQITPIKKHVDGKVICRTLNRLLLIPEDEIQEIGWN
jgi:hypothetical protein